MRIFEPQVRIEKNNWKPGDALSFLIGDINPKTAFGMGFVFKQHETEIYGLLKCVFQLNINAIDGSRIEFEVWVMNMFDNAGKRPPFYDILMLAFDAREIFKQKLSDSASANRTMVLPPFPFTEQDIQRELMEALNGEYPPNSN